MDQIKTGKFIAEKRKEKSLTQQELAALLGISNKTVSKWECGNGMPEVGLMLPLCDVLNMSVNELLSGESLSNTYTQKAEENLLGLVKEKQAEKIRGKRAVLLQGISLLCSGVLWLLLFADSNVYQLGQTPTPLTLFYLLIGFSAIYAVCTFLCLSVVKKSMVMLLLSLSFASFACLVICFQKETFWLMPPAMVGTLLCFILCLWRYWKTRYPIPSSTPTHSSPQKP